MIHEGNFAKPIFEGLLCCAGTARKDVASALGVEIDADAVRFFMRGEEEVVGAFDDITTEEGEQPECDGITGIVWGITKPDMGIAETF